MASPSAFYLPITKEGIKLAGKRIRNGQLVAFPTETVYGLGANALDTKAVLSIFQAKERPLTDPVIVHVASLSQALELVELDDIGQTMFTTLATKFWPGPLTLIAKARSHIPSCISAGSGYVGIRWPSHPVAQALITSSGCPIAAPSANTFGHVSPTCPEHVFTDLQYQDVAILSGGPSCAIGIESTVAKVISESSSLLILRRGGVSEVDLSKHYTIVVHDALCPAKSVDQEHQQSPGQLLTHYAPSLPTSLIQKDDDNNDEELINESTVLIDFNGLFLTKRNVAGAYRDLSPVGDVQEAMRVLYDTLRWGENQKKMNSILLVYVHSVKNVQSDPHIHALYDRMYRAASGQFAHEKSP